MRIGILTLPFNNNYGGYLQAYALITVLKRMGHDVELIYRRPNKRPLRQRMIYPFKTIVKTFLRMPHGPFFMNQEYDLRKGGVNMMSFVDKYIQPRSRPYYTTNTMRRGCEGKYDIIIVGSDQVWRPIYVPRIEDFFLDFITDVHVKKIAYAASFGTSIPELSVEEIETCKKLIANFSAVSVREKSGLDVINKFGWKTCILPVVVLDPTLLLSKNNYENLVSQTKNSKPLNKICCYILDENPIVPKIIRKVESVLNIQSFNIIDQSLIKRKEKPSIEEWLNSIKSSKFVVTDSFHGMVFCIIFNTPFTVFINRDRGADRFISLLSQLGLENRMCTKYEDITSVLKTTIDWVLVNEKVAYLQKLSMKFLEENIK